MPSVIWAKQGPYAQGAALGHLLRWLVTTQGLFIIKQAYSGGASNNTLRTPASPAEQATFQNATFTTDGTFSWIAGNTPAANDWVVLESTNAGTKFQLYFEYQANATTNSWYVYVLQKGDYSNAADGAGVKNCILPACINASGAFAVPASPPAAGIAPGLQNSMTYSAQANSGYVQIFADDGTANNRRWMYFGKPLSTHASVTYPFILRAAATTMAPSSNADRWYMLAQDGTTVAASGDVTYSAFVSSSVDFLATAGQDGVDNIWTVLPWTVHFRTALNVFPMVLNDTWQCSVDLASSGTIDGMAYVQALGNAAGAHWAMTWDGVTTYP